VRRLCQLGGPRLDVGQPQFGQRHQQRGPVGGDDDAVAPLQTGVEQHNRSAGGGRPQLGPRGREQEPFQARQPADFRQYGVVLGPQPFPTEETGPLTISEGERITDLVRKGR